MQKKIILSILFFALLISCFCPIIAFAEAETHQVNITWLYYPDFYIPGDAPNDGGGEVIGTTSFVATEGEQIDISYYKDHPAGASYKSISTIVYNGVTCYLGIVVGYGGRGVNPVTGEPVDGLPFDVDPFGYLTMPGTDVDIYYIYSSFKNTPTPPEDSLDKIVIYVNNDNQDINPQKQEYYAYEIFHVGKSENVVEDVTTDYTIGNIQGDGFAYWISEDDPWYSVVSEMTDYFILTETTVEGTYIIQLNPGKPATEDTAKEIAHYLEANIPEDAPVKIITADTPSYDNDPGYYLIISDINSNLILGTTNIAITEKAEYPTIDKTISETDVNAGYGEIIPFTVTIHYPQGSRADSIITDTMSEGLTYIDDSFVINIEDYSLDITPTGFIINIDRDILKELAAGENGFDLVFSYSALVNSKEINSKNNVRLDFSHYATEDNVTLSTTSFTLLKYAADDEEKNPLPGAVFQLLDNEQTPIKLVETVPSKEYRIATSEDTNTVLTILTADSKIKISGIDADLTYYLTELIAPNGYHLLSESIEVKNIAIDGSTEILIANNNGPVLPSTGGIGTTLFYIIGLSLIAISFILFIKRKYN